MAISEGACGHEMVEKLTPEAQINNINAAMMERVIFAYGKLIHEHGHLPEIAKEEVGQMMVIATEVKHHLLKEGSLEGLRVQVGANPIEYDQALYITNSFVGELLNPDEKSRLENNYQGWSSKIPGLDIIREEKDGKFEYFLADKGPNWVEGS